MTLTLFLLFAQQGDFWPVTLFCWRTKHKDFYNCSPLPRYKWRPEYGTKDVYKYNRSLGYARDRVRGAEGKYSGSVKWLKTSVGHGYTWWVQNISLCGAKRVLLRLIFWCPGVNFVAIADVCMILESTATVCLWDWPFFSQMRTSLEQIVCLKK